MSWKDRLYSLAFAVGVAGTAASVIAGIGYALYTDAALPSLELGVAPRARALLDEGSIEGALQELEIASQIAYGDPAVLRNFLAVAEASQQQGPRIAALASWVDLQPRSPDRRAALLEALMVQIQRDQAAGSASLPTIDEALVQAEALLSLEPDSARSYSYIGLALLMRNLVGGDPADAVRAARHLEQAIALGAEGADPRQALALAQARARQPRGEP